MPDWEELPLLSSHTAQRSDDAGNVLAAGTIDEASVNIDPRVSDFILYGVFNGAFARGPVGGVGSAIGDDNPLPDWTGPTQPTGGAITCQWVEDSSSPSGKNLRFNIAPGAAGDEAYFEQIVPIGGVRSRISVDAVRASVLRVSATGGAPTAAVKWTYLDATGAVVGADPFDSSTQTLSADATLYSVGFGNATTVPAGNATSLRIRVHVARNTMAATDSGIVDITDVRRLPPSPKLLFPDASAPTTYAHGQIRQSNGQLLLSPVAATATGWVSVQGGLILASTIYPSISASQNNWAPTGFATCTGIAVDINAATRTITGFDATSWSEGQAFWISAYNTSTGNLTLAHRSASSSAGNRIDCPNAANYTLVQQGGVWIVYIPSVDPDNPWRVLGKT